MAGEICGPFCIPRSSPNRMTSMYGPTSAEVALEVRQIAIDAAGRGTPAARSRLAGQEHEEPVDAVAALAELEQIAAEQADDRPIGPLAEPPGALDEPPVAVGPGDQGPGRRRDGRPHDLVGRLGDSVEIVAVPETASGTARSRAPRRASSQSTRPDRLRSTHCPSSPLGQRPDGHLRRRAVGQRPIGPVASRPGRTRAPVRSCRRRNGPARRRRSRRVAGSGRTRESVAPADRASRRSFA